jgi:hypothetical protein
MSITSSQKQRIENVFLNSTTLTKTDLYFLCFLSNKNKKKAAMKILNSIDNLDVDDYDLNKFMDGFVYLYPNSDLIELNDDFNYSHTRSQKQNQVRTFLESARVELNGN